MSYGSKEMTRGIQVYEGDGDFQPIVLRIKAKKHRLERLAKHVDDRLQLRLAGIDKESLKLLRGLRKAKLERHLFDRIVLNGNLIADGVKIEQVVGKVRWQDYGIYFTYNNLYKKIWSYSEYISRHEKLITGVCAVCGEVPPCPHLLSKESKA